MKIAIVLNTSWNILNFRSGLIKALMEQGHEVHAIAPHDTYSAKLVELGCIYHRIKMDSRGVNPLKDLALTVELFVLYRKIRPDLILHYTIKPNIFGSFAAGLLGIPAVNNVCGLGTAFMKNNLISKIALILFKLAFRFPNKIFFQNGYDKQYFIENNLVNKSKVEVLPGSGLNLNKFKPSFTKSGSKFTFLLVSRLIYDKGILEYVEAIKILREKGVDAKFQLLGPEDPKHKRGIPLKVIEKWIEQNALEYLGSTDDVQAYLKEADCVVLPSYREGTPRTLLEAAGCAKPIVTTDVPGCNSVVQHGKNGFLCKMKSSFDLADKMHEMYSLPPDQLWQMGQNGRQMIENCFDENLVIDKYLQTINQINN